MASNVNEPYGLYGSGNTAGSKTPADDSDLRSSSANPYSAGSQVDATGPGTGAGYGPLSTAPSEYYSNPATVGGNPAPEGRPFSHDWSSGSDPTDYMSGNLDALYGDIMQNRQPPQRKR
ncbi:MAG TPA: hypothetical protein VKQ30_18810 [Ktedonobacterales bacterium]|nr:hypothetical protein [Ktedonobacterales bacterium]